MPRTRSARRPTRGVALALLLALALTGCGKDSDTDKPGADKPGASASPSSAAHPDAAGTARPAAGKSFKGTGYAFRAPKGWKSATATAKKLNPQVDLAVSAGPDDSGFSTNINVVVSDAGVSDPSSAQLDEISRAIKARLQKLVPKLKVDATTSLAGSTALHHEGAATKSGVKYYIDQYIAFHGKSAYTITFSFGRSAKPAARNALAQSVLAGWTWR